MSDQDVSQKCNHIFEEIDQNHSGGLDVSEFATYVKKISSHIGKANITDEEVVELFKKLDTNGDGELSKDEFRAFVTEFFSNL